MDFDYKKATPLEVIDYVEDFLLKQGEPSFLAFEGCLYRHPKGLKCAAGCLIPDNLYDSSMEGKSTRRLPFDFRPHTKLISDLQTIHDRGAGDYGVSAAPKPRSQSFNDFILQEIGKLREEYA